VPVHCDDDGDACTDDRCDPALGCTHPSLVVDADGDGVPGPRPGFAPGAPASCGADCDDHDAAVFPGNLEATGCDGVDNDCNGVIDDGAHYTPSLTPPLRVSGAEFVRASRAGLVAAPDRFVLSYTGTLPSSGGERSVGRIKALSAAGTTIFENPVSQLNANTYGGALAWSGDTLASAWGDARQGGSYEIYFNRFNLSGDKLGADQRVTSARGFSLDANVIWSRSEFLVAWDDRRDEGRVEGDDVRIFGERVLDGRLNGSNLELIADDPIAENPVLALGSGRVGLVYTTLDTAPVSHLGFRTFDQDLSKPSPHPTPIGSDVDSPGLYFMAGQFIALWSVHATNWGDAIWGASFGEDGSLRLAPRPITTGAHFARSHSAVSLGDRLLLFWADDHDGNYEIYWQILGADLSPVVPRQRLTNTAANSVGPVAVLGMNGEIGVMYDDWQSGTEQVYFTSLTCTVRQ
jgi:hypothetical protein